MRLLNFSLTDVSDHGRMIAIKAAGFEWDLHNDTDFEGFLYSTTLASLTLTLKWRVSERIIKWRDTGCQYGVPNYPANSFNLVFTDVDYLEIAPRDMAMPKGEDLGISSISCIEEGEDLKAYVHTGLISCFHPAQEELSYHIMFRFNGGQIIRVGAEKAEFTMMP